MLPGESVGDAWVDVEAAADAIDRAEGALRTGQFDRAGSQATVAAEALDGFAATGSPIDFASTRPDVLTRGIDLDALIGRTWTIGDVLCRGSLRCEPCAHLERVSGPGHRRPRIHRSGLRADILTDGTIPTRAAIRPGPDGRVDSAEISPSRSE